MAKINILPLRHWWQIAWHTPSSAVRSSEEGQRRTEAYATNTKERLRNLLHLVWQTDIMEKCVGGLRPGGCLRSRFLWYVKTAAWQQGKKQDNTEKNSREGVRKSSSINTHSSYWPKTEDLHIKHLMFSCGRHKVCLHLNKAHVLISTIKKINK